MLLEVRERRFETRDIATKYPTNKNQILRTLLVVLPLLLLVPRPTKRKVLTL